jgi:hypothetical protein
VSLRGGLLRLMMAGFFVINPLDFWVQFLISEIIGHLSNQNKEEVLMVVKVLRETKSFAIKLIRNVIISWEIHLPYRLSLLMIW